MLIWVEGDASRVPGWGEIVSRAVFWPLWLLANATPGAAMPTSIAVAAATAAVVAIPNSPFQDNTGRTYNEDVTLCQTVRQTDWYDHDVSTQSQRRRHREHRGTTRRQILEAADHLLREHPYRELTVDAVMAQTGLTRTAFYRHFDDVTDLVLRLFADLSQELYVIAERWAASAGVGYPAPGLEGLAGIVDFYVRHGPLVRAITEAAATDEEIERAYRSSIEALIELAGEAMERMARAGLLQVPDARALARAMTRMNESYLLEEFGHEPQGERDVALATLATVWLRLVTPPAEA